MPSPRFACYPLASPAGTVRLWIGAHPVTAPPVVDGWQVNGAPPQTITTVRPMQSVRTGSLLRGNSPRAFTGVYELRGVPHATMWKVQFTVDGTTLRRDVKPLPSRIELAGDPFTVLLSSCFDYSTDGGLYGDLLPRIARGARSPDLCVFMGDQVYLDLPTLMNFQDDAGWLGEKFEQDYVRNWFSGSFTDGLGIAPMAFVPDDHEYWNNFPHPSPFIQNSWSGGGQDNWRLAARACYDGFQLGFDRAENPTLRIDIPPLSFLLLDSRADRDRDLKRLISDKAGERLATWADDVAGASEFIAGVLVTGQSLLESPVGAVKGGIADYALANYEAPYRGFLEALTTVADRGKQVLLLTGDVHWGRVTSVRDRRRDTIAFHELITSPASLVSTVGADQIADVVGAVKGWFGAGDLWPRHGEGKEPPAHLPYSDQRFRTGTWTAHRGNQCAIYGCFGAAPALWSITRFIRWRAPATASRR